MKKERKFKRGGGQLKLPSRHVLVTDDEADKLEGAGAETMIDIGPDGKYVIVPRSPNKAIEKPNFNLGGNGNNNAPF